MFVNVALRDKVRLLDDFAMESSCAVMPFSKEHYLEEFLKFYEIKGRKHKLKLSQDSLYKNLEEMCAYGKGRPVAEKTEEMFGLPLNIYEFEDEKAITEQMEGMNGGCSGFYFVFYVIFCEYEDFVLCFFSGSND